MRCMCHVGIVIAAHVCSRSCISKVAWTGWKVLSPCTIVSTSTILVGVACDEAEIHSLTLIYIFTLDGFFEHRSHLRELQQVEDIFNIGRPSYLIPEHGSCHEVLGRLLACCAIKLRWSGIRWKLIGTSVGHGVICLVELWLIFWLWLCSRCMHWQRNSSEAGVGLHLSLWRRSCLTFAGKGTVA